MVGLAVRWLIGREDLSLRLRAGSVGAIAQVTFAVTTELPHPGRWLSGGEVVLTTGMGLPADPAGRRAYVRELVDSDIAALGFGVGLSFSDIPAELLDEADTCGLAVFEVPFATPFAAVVKAVMERLAEQQYEQMLAASRAQPRMTRAAANGGVAAIVHELSRASGGLVTVVDPQARIVAHGHTPPSDNVMSMIASLVAESPHGDAIADSSVIPVEDCTVVVQTIRLGRHIHGYLVVELPGDARAVDQVLIGHANSLLALDFHKPRRLRAEQARVNTTAMRILLAGEYDESAARSVLLAAADSQEQVRVIAVRGSHDHAAVGEAVDDRLGGAGRAMFHTVGSDDLIIVVRGSDDIEFVSGLFVDLPTDVRDHLRIGVSAAHDAGDLRAAADQARMAAVVAPVGGEPEDALRAVGRTLLCAPDVRRVLDTLAGVLVDPIVDYDTKHGTDLLASLRAFLEANGQWEHAAVALGVHRHTLRSRLLKIRDIVDCDLDSARVRAELLLAITARSGTDGETQWQT
ncbi:PucR family transcriptional regulator [Gordonia sp. NPDC003422]